MSRQTPISILLAGAPKIGKSHFAFKIASDINLRTTNVKNYVHCITLTTEHFDGYVQQPIVIFDDHYKLNDGIQKIDASAVMNVVSCTKFYPPFAHLEYKGLDFNSKFLIISSNFGYPRTQFLASALHRRHKHHIILIKNNKPMNANFDHLNIYHTIEIIDPWNGNYQFPFSEMMDVPFDLKSMSVFPFKERYKLIHYNQLINIIIDDFENESRIYNDIMSKMA